MKIELFVRLIALPALLAFSSSASVIYTFSGSGFGGAEAFALSVPAVITADTTFRAASLQSCTIQNDSCGSVAILPSGPGDAAHHPEIDIVAQLSGNTASYFFPFNAFQATGSYTSVFPFNPATLTVASSSSNVPEPASYALTLSAIFTFAFYRFRVARRVRM